MTQHLINVQHVTSNFPHIRNQAEMAHTCRGTISLHGALIHTENPASFNFVVSNGGGTQVGLTLVTNQIMLLLENLQQHPIRILSV